jgi:hypothetical protein
MLDPQTAGTPWIPAVPEGRHWHEVRQDRPPRQSIGIGLVGDIRRRQRGLRHVRHPSRCAAAFVRAICLVLITVRIVIIEEVDELDVSRRAVSAARLLPDATLPACAGWTLVAYCRDADTPAFRPGVDGLLGKGRYKSPSIAQDSDVRVLGAERRLGLTSHAGLASFECWQRGFCGKTPSHCACEQRWHEARAMEAHERESPAEAIMGKMLT